MQSKFEAEVCEGQLQTPDGATVKTILAKPQTYMNEFGRTVGAIMRKHYLAPADIVVFHDEIDMALGRFRMADGPQRRRSQRHPFDLRARQHRIRRGAHGRRPSRATRAR